MSEKRRGLGQMTVGGQQRIFQVNGIRQANAFCEVMNIELDEYWQKMATISENGQLTNQVMTIAFIYSALFAGAKKERIPVDFDYEDVLDWFEDADESEAEEFLKPVALFTEMLAQNAQAYEQEQKGNKPKKV